MLNSDCLEALRQWNFAAAEDAMAQDGSTNERSLVLALSNWLGDVGNPEMPGALGAIVTACVDLLESGYPDEGFDRSVVFGRTLGSPALVVCTSCGAAVVAGHEETHKTFHRGLVWS